jgi:type I restriction enzyme S subunit
MKMREGWGKVKLIDVAHFAKEKISTEEISLRNYISTENMLPEKNGVLVAEKLPAVKKITEFQQGDILFSNIRTYFKKVWFASFDGGASNDVLVIRAKEIVDNKFLYYVLSDDKFIQYSVSTSKGTKMPRGDKNAIMNYEFFLPPLSTQKKIARILSALDDKIELNRQMNRTLEAMAQAIFKSCFVDFDPVHAKAACRSEADYEAAAKRLGISREVLELFPDEFEESELGMIPKGWEIVPYIDEISLTGGGTPKRSEKSYWNGNIPWFSVKDVPEDGNIFVIDTSEKITEEGLKNSSTKLIPTNTTIITARGTVGKLALVGVDMAMNQSCYAVSNKNNFSFFEYFRLKRLTYELKRKTHGAVFDTITTATFKAIKTTKIPNEIVKEFEKIIYPVIMQIKNNLKEIQTLQQTRDTLLPKLLSGELDVSRQ